MNRRWTYYRTMLSHYLRVVGPQGVWRAVIAKATGKVAIVAVKSPGIRHPIFLRLPSTDLAVYEQVFLSGEYEVPLASSPSVIVDVGANIGLASIYFANRFPESRILSIEADSGNFAILARNVASYPNVVPLHAALWFQEGTLDVFDRGIGEWGFTTGEAKMERDRGPSRGTVRAITIETLLADFRLDQIDLLKVDIEGAEKEVFEHSDAWLPRVNTLLVETHERLKPGSHQSVMDATANFPERSKWGENFLISRTVMSSESTTRTDRLTAAEEPST